MAAPQIPLIPLAADRRDTFIQELQNAFAVAIVEEYGPQEGEIVPMRTLSSPWTGPARRPWRSWRTGQSWAAPW